MTDRKSVPIRFSSVTKTYQDVTALDAVDLEVGSGEFITLLGPSGSGKTTLLMVLAGFTRPTSGTVRVDGEDITRQPPHKRDLGMVFQSYALFPHLNVFENVAFGLKARKMPKDEIAPRVAEALELVQLSELETRRVTEISGGQQQRVALARALAVHPDILLLDEPLSNLDAELRYSTRRQMAELQKRLGTTAIYVTHDQEEALELANRIAIMRDGVCEQIGTPAEVLDAPATPFVEAFLERQRRISRRV